LTRSTRNSACGRRLDTEFARDNEAATKSVSQFFVRTATPAASLNRGGHRHPTETPSKETRTMNQNQINVFLAAAALACTLATAPTITAQSSWKSKSYSKSVGNSNLGGTVRTYVRANYYRSATSSTGGVYGSVSATGRLLGGSREIAYARAYGSVTIRGRSASPYASALVRIAGKTIFTKSGRTNVRVPFRTNRYNLFPKDLTKRVPVYGPIFVTVRGNLGIGLQFGASVSFPTNRTDLSGYGRTWAYAKASVSAGVPEVLEAGVEFKGNAADQMLSVVLSSRPTSQKLSGKAVYTIRALSLKLSAFVLAIVPFPTCYKVWTKNCWQKKFSFKLASWSSSQVNKTLLNLF
jgi:hypothetical protein